MKIEFTVPFRRVPTPLSIVAEPTPGPLGHPPRIARLIALAHKLDALVRSEAFTATPNSRAWVTCPRRALLKLWSCCIWRPRSRNTFYSSPQGTRASLPSCRCARSPGSRAGIANRNFSSSISRNDLLLWRERVIHVVTAKTTDKEY
jgi:hypothetical protein